MPVPNQTTYFGDDTRLIVLLVRVEDNVLFTVEAASHQDAVRRVLNYAKVVLKCIPQASVECYRRVDAKHVRVYDATGTEIRPERRKKRTR